MKDKKPEANASGFRPPTVLRHEEARGSSYNSICKILYIITIVLSNHFENRSNPCEQTDTFRLEK